MAQGRLDILKELRRSLQQSLNDARSAQKDERFWGRMLVSAKFVKATSNVILSSVEIWRPEVKVISATSNYIQSRFENHTGYDKAKSIVKFGSKLLPKEAEIATNEVLKRSDLIKDALSGSINERKIAKYSIDQHLYIAEKIATETGNIPASKIIKTIKEINDYAFKIYEIFEENNDNYLHNNGESSAIMTIIHTLSAIENKIKKLEILVVECDIPEFKSLSVP